MRTVKLKVASKDELILAFEKSLWATKAWVRD